MKYTLFGSKTSPFVRRTRMLLEGIPYEFKEMDVFGADAELLNSVNPINQVPVFLDGDQKIWDSRMIFNYLNSKHRFQEMSWEDENLLTAMDGATNSGVSLLLMKRSGMDIEGDQMFIRRQRERIKSILDYLGPFIKDDGLKVWNIHSMTLYCFLDWAAFRGIINMDKRPECQQFLKTHADRPIIKETAIPKG